MVVFAKDKIEGIFGLFLSYSFHEGFPQTANGRFMPDRRDDMGIEFLTSRELFHNRKATVNTVWKIGYVYVNRFHC